MARCMHWEIVYVLCFFDDKYTSREKDYPEISISKCIWRVLYEWMQYVQYKKMDSAQVFFVISSHLEYNEKGCLSEYVNLLRSTP